MTPQAAKRPSAARLTAAAGAGHAAPDPLTERTSA